MLTVTVVDVHNRYGFVLLFLAGKPGEQFRLRFKVVFHRAMKIEMVLCEISEHGDVPFEAACALLGQRVRRDFHCRRFATGIGHLRQQFL